MNAFLPARCGDALKIALLVRASSGRSWAEIAGVFVAERLVEICVVIGLLVGPGAAWVARMGFTPSWGSVLIAVVGVALVLFVTRRFGIIRQFLGGLGVLRRPVPVLAAAALALVLWLAEASALRLLAGELGLTLALGQAAAVLALLNVAIAVPVTVANVGPYEAALVVGLTACGARLEDAIAISLLHHAIQLATLGMWAAVLLGSGRLANASNVIVVSDLDKRRAIRHYDRLAGKYDEVVSRGIGRILRDRERGVVLEFAALTESGKSMIDVGCGGGFFALSAKGNGMRVCAIDAAPGMVAAIADRVDEARVDDLEKLEPDRRYDRVVCAGVLDFVLDPSAAFRRLCRLTQAGGRLVIAAPRFGFGGLLYALEKRLVSVRINLFSLAWFRRMAEENGMRLVGHAYPLPNNLAVCLEPEAVAGTEPVP